jgi:hypothetical protein
MPAAGPLRIESVVRERVLTASVGAFVATMIAFAARGAIAGPDTFVVVVAGFACVAVCLGCSYVALDEVRSKGFLRCRIEARRQRSAAVQYSIAVLQRGVSAANTSKEAKLAGINSRESASIALYRRQVSLSRVAIDASNAKLANRRCVLDELEAAEVARLLSEVRARHESLLGEGAFFSNICVDELHRNDQKAFQKWKAFFNRLAAAGPSAIRSEDRVKIQLKYDLERRRVDRCEFFARGRARNKMMKIRAARSRRQKHFAVSRTEIRCRYQRRRTWLQRIIEQARCKIENYRTEISRYEAEMTTYKDVRFSNYILRIFGIL